MTDKHLEAIRDAARTIEYGSVTINISATSNKLDLNIQRRVRLEDDPGEDKPPVPGSGIVQYERPGTLVQARIKKKA